MVKVTFYTMSNFCFNYLGLLHFIFFINVCSAQIDPTKPCSDPQIKPTNFVVAKGRNFNCSTEIIQNDIQGHKPFSDGAR